MSIKTVTTETMPAPLSRVKRLGMVLAAGQLDTLVGMMVRPELDGAAFLDAVRR